MTELRAADVFPNGAGPVPGSVHEGYVQERLAEVGLFGSETLSECVRRHARDRGERVAYAAAGGLRLTWIELDDLADRLAALFISMGVEPGDRVAVYYPDGPVVHAAYLATERAGAIAVGIGPRAAIMEVSHLVALAGASIMLTALDHRGRDMTDFVAEMRGAGLPIDHHLMIDPDRPDLLLLDGARVAGAGSVAGTPLPAGRALGLGDIFMLNSTSGTTGMPKCVVHNQNRWVYYHTQVLRTAGLTSEDVWLGLIPAPYGFGIWTAHVSPILLGVTTVVMPRFSAPEALRLIETERVTVMASVTTQFIMMLNAPNVQQTNLSSLRYLYTGGEAIPYQRAEQFEQQTGAVLLNFYGSNETGLLSYTTAADTAEQRLDTGGRIVDDLMVRLLDENLVDLPIPGDEPGIAACRGPATSLGYYADPLANERLFSPDGWMLTGDLCTIDDERYLRVVGRTADFIIRGGKNVSAAAVEEQVATHPAVALVAAVAVPDEVFGERVCVVVELKPGKGLELPDLLEHLAARGVSKDMWPERLDIVDTLPRASGGKVAKGELRRQYSAVG